MDTPHKRLLLRKIYEHMRANRLSRAALSRKLGWSQSDLCDTLKGRKSVGKKRRRHIMDKLDLDPDDLLLYSKEVETLANLLQRAFEEDKRLFKSVSRMITERLGRGQA